MRIARDQHHGAFPFGWVILGILVFLAFILNASGQVATRVESVGFTVSDMDKALDFYTKVLPFEKVSDVETFGTEFEHLSGVFGARVRIVRLKLGNEVLELTEYFTPQGRAENLEKFRQSPESYAPQYGGYCSYAVSKGYTADADPQAWKIVGGKLFLNYDQEVKEIWEKEESDNIRKATGNWKEFKTKQPEHKG